jgi:hypothetical protein
VGVNWWGHELKQMLAALAGGKSFEIASVALHGTVCRCCHCKGVAPPKKGWGYVVHEGVCPVRLARAYVALLWPEELDKP